MSLAIDDERDAVAEPVEEQSWPVTIKLAYPVAFGSVTVEALTFRRGRLSDIKGIRVDVTPSADQIMMMASRMCGQPLKVIESLDADDTGAVIELVLTFFARCLGAGKTH